MPVRSARLYICGLGYHEAFIEGKKVSENLLEPAFTKYDALSYYRVYDVTEHLPAAGPATLGVALGNGWYNCFTEDAWNIRQASWRAVPKLLCELYITYADGTQDCICSDTGWKTSPGPITFNSIRNGEWYDARLELPGWSESTYGADGWQDAELVRGAGGVLRAAEMQPIRVMQELAPVNAYRTQEGRWIFDLGQNFAGKVRLTAYGPAGSEIVLRYCEDLTGDGQHVEQKHISGFVRTGEFQTDKYIKKSDGPEEWTPQCVYHGFRYVQLSIEGEVEVLAIEAQQVRSDVRTIGTFSCSDACINGIEKMVVRTEENNFHGIPTDCPQRDERMGWLNDATVRMEEAVYHFDLAAFLEKWMWDIRDTQAPDGSITDTAPFRFGTRPADPVCSSFLLIPWLLLLHYGDDTCLRTHYDAMKAWVGYLGTMAQEQIIHYSRFGDWASPRSESEDTAFGSGARSATTPGDFMSTGYYYYDAVLMERFALHVGQDEAARFYQALAHRLRAAF